MRKGLILIGLFALLFSSCKTEEENLFELSADERTATAIANLKAKLTAPSNGWRARYRPSPETGAFYVLLNFTNDNKVNIKSDLSAADGAYYDQTVSYRIDSSLGLELIFETYSFFSFLYDPVGGGLGGEFEFNYVNETPGGELVFSSKSDRSNRTTMVLEPSIAGDINLIGTTLSENLNTISRDFSKFSSSIRIEYENKDLAVYVSLDALSRIINFNYVGLKSNSQVGESLDFSTSFIISGNSIVLDEPLNVNFQNNAVNINQLDFTGEILSSPLDLCTNIINLHSLTGSVPSTNDNISFGTTLFDPNGARIFERSDYFFGPIRYIYREGSSIGQEITGSIPGAVEVHLIYNITLNDGSILTAMGFVIVNEEGDALFALKEFEETIVDNKITFNFKEEFRFLGNTSIEVNEEKINEYLGLLTEGDNTYIFSYNQDIFELYNPCNQFNMVFFAND